VEFSYADASQKTSGFSYYTKAEKIFTIEPNDLIVKVDQQKLFFASTFEPNQKLNDSLSYDITAWALRMVEGYALKTVLLSKQQKQYMQRKTYLKMYMLFIPWNNRVSAQVLSLLHQE
jgi:hypothetical protein